MTERLSRGSRVGALVHDNGTCLAPAMVLSADDTHATVYVHIGGEPIEHHTLRAHADTVDEPAATHFTPKWKALERNLKGPVWPGDPTPDDRAAPLSGQRSTSARPLGRRHYCATSQGHQLFHTYGDGAPRRKRCAYCGGRIAVLIGTYGVSTWRGDGRYRIEDAVRLFARERTADAYADEHGPAAGGLVVRWIVDPQANFTSEPRAAAAPTESDTEKTA